MTDELVKRLRNKTRDSILKENDRVEAANRIEALTAERDAAYASGYSDAETEISKSVLGLENTFLHSQYADAKLRIEDLQAQTMRLSGMVRDLKKEVAISDALLISEGEASLARLERAEKAEAERDAAKAKVERLGREVNVAKYGQPDFAWSVHLAAMDELQAERDRLREALGNIVADCEADYPPSHGAIKYEAKLALKGETP